jgi:ribosomal protein L13
LQLLDYLTGKGSAFIRAAIFRDETTISGSEFKPIYFRRHESVIAGCRKENCANFEYERRANQCFSVNRALPRKARPAEASSDLSLFKIIFKKSEKNIDT